MTIKDIAKLAGVSVSTVSRVLNDHPDVSRDRRERVLSVIRESGYVPNGSARDLVRTKSDAVGLIVRGAQNPFFTDIIHAIESELDQRHYTMVMRQIASWEDEVRAAAAMEREKRLIGLILLGGRSDYTPAQMSLLTVPHVFCTFTNGAGTLDPSTYSSVSIDDRAAAESAVTELIRSGHRRIAALIADRDDSSISQLRFEGYERALRKHGLTPDPALVFATDDSFRTEDAYRVMTEALLRRQDFTALFAISDDMAIGAMRALREAGRSVPEDTSVIAIDGIGVSEYMNPMLTTVCQPMEGLGKRSAELLDQMIRGGEARQLTLPTTLRRGGSVRSL